MLAILHNTEDEALQVVPPEPAIGWLESVQVYLDAALDSPNTRRAYSSHLRGAGALFGWRPLSELTGRDLVEYRRCVTDSTWAPSTKALALCALRSFLSWAGTLGGHQLPKDVITTALRSPSAKVETPFSVLTEREMASLLAAGDSPRNSALLVTFLGAGLRVSEVAALNIEHLVQEHEGGMIVFVKQGKGRRDRSVPVHDEVQDALCEYLASTRRYLGSTGPLFLSEDRGASSRGNEGQRLTARSIGRIVRDLAAAAGISAKRVTCHALRHSYAIRCIRSGGSPVAVSKLLGHASLATTTRYVAHLELAELRAAVPHLPSRSA